MLQAGSRRFVLSLREGFHEGSEQRANGEGASRGQMERERAEGEEGEQSFGRHGRESKSRRFSFCF
jgi:hypothetical protein